MLLLAEFVSLSDRLQLSEEVCCCILGVSAEAWSDILDPNVLERIDGPRSLKRLAYAVPLMRRRLARRGGYVMENELAEVAHR